MPAARASVHAFARATASPRLRPPPGMVCLGSHMSPRAGRLCLCLALLGFLAGCSLPQVGENGSPAASLAVTPAVQATPAEFSPLLLVTTQVAHADIYVHAVNGVGPRYLPAARLYRGQRAFVLPFARGYALGRDGRADLTFEVAIRKADGTPDGEPVAGVLWQDRVPGADWILLPATLITFWTEPTDPLGPYEFTARVRDAVSGREETLRQTVEIVDYEPPELPERFDPDRWFQNYYLLPTPELALPALGALFNRLPADRRENALPPVLGFYDQLLGDNPWLLPSFGRRLLAAPSDEAFALSLVLAYHLRAQTAAPDGVPAAAWERLRDFSGYAWPGDTAADLVRPAQLDDLWGRFYASGLYAPVERLLQPLAHSADLGALERWQAARAQNDAGVDFDNDPDDPALPVEVRRELVLRAALWSLLSNAGSHPLIEGYLRWSVVSEAVDPAVREILRRALAPAPAADAKPKT